MVKAFFILLVLSTFTSSSSSEESSTIGEDLFLFIFGLDKTASCTLCHLWGLKTDSNSESSDLPCKQQGQLFTDAVTCLLFGIVTLCVASVSCIQWKNKRARELKTATRMSLSPRIRPKSKNTKSQLTSDAGIVIRKPKKAKRKRLRSSRALRLALRKTSNPLEVDSLGIYDRGVMTFGDNVSEYQYLQDSGVFDIPDDRLDTLMCIKAECKDHHHDKFRLVDIKDDINKGTNDQTNTECVSLDAADEKVERDVKSVHFDFRPDVDEPCPRGVTFLPETNDIGPPRLSSTMVESSDEEFSGGIDDLLNSDDTILESSTEVMNNSSFFQQTSEFFHSLTSAFNPWSLRRRIVTPFGGILGDGFWARLTSNSVIAGVNEQTRRWTYTVGHAASQGVRSVAEKINDLEDSLNNSFMNDNLEFSDAVKNVSFYGNDLGSVQTIASALAVKVAFDKVQNFVRNRNNSADVKDSVMTCDTDLFSELPYHADCEYSDTE